MKKYILALLAASVVTAPVAAQSFEARSHHQVRGSSDQHFGSRDSQDHRWQQSRKADRRWQRGDRFDRRHARGYREIRNPRYYRLYNAPRGYRWVQSGNDAVLVAITTGIIASILANRF